MTAARRFLPAVMLALALGASAARGADDVPPAPDGAAPADSAARPAAPALVNGLEPLVPEVAGQPYRMEPGERSFTHRLSFSPAYGYLGSEPLYVFRAAYSPSAWLGYEGSIGHNPGQAVHAVIHSLTILLRHPFPGRLQPFVSGGYGMVMVFPGQSLNADPVTKNTLNFGGGLEFYIRNDLAIRADLRQSSVFGNQRDTDGVVVYDYSQGTIGLAFYRSIQP